MTFKICNLIFIISDKKPSVSNLFRKDTKYYFKYTHYSTKQHCGFVFFNIIDKISDVDNFFFPLFILFKFCFSCSTYLSYPVLFSLPFIVSYNNPDGCHSWRFLPLITIVFHALSSYCAVIQK